MRLEAVFVAADHPIEAGTTICTALGFAVVLQEPKAAGSDTVATVVTTAGIRLGFIG